MNALDVLNDHEYAYRLKTSDGGAMIVGRDKILWSLTLKYFKQISPELVDNYDDWQPMLTDKHSQFYDLLAGVKQGHTELKIHGRTVIVQSTITDSSPVATEVDSSRVEISDSALKAAGQVAEALGIAIGCYTGRDQPRADEALKELIWIAKNVSWETKSNRRQFQSKWNPPKAIPPKEL